MLGLITELVYARTVRIYEGLWIGGPPLFMNIPIPHQTRVYHIRDSVWRIHRLSYGNHNPWPLYR